MIDIAVVGTGHLGTIHAKLWKGQEGANLVAVVDPDEERGRAVAASHDVDWYASINTLPAVDAVTIAAPTSQHFALAVQCLDRGFHCFIEKPVTATHAEALELMKHSALTQRVVQVGHVERFNPAVRALEHITMAPLFVEAHRLSSFKPRAIDVSVIHDLMIHDIDLILWLTQSSVVDVAATGVAVLTDTPDICNARITFANGCVANLTASRISAKPLRKMRIFQKDNYVSLDLAAPSAEFYRLIETSALDTTHQIPIGTVATQHGDRMIVFDKPNVDASNAIADEQRSFLHSIQTGTTAAVTLQEGAEAVRVAELIEACL
ncbi:MAG: Gfo/Idh/MocA family oxidoreductase [bacterium]|nr:Gfo/Idh/MocA family oxidoreductase [bacterium]